MILRTIMDRGDHYKYLNGELNLDNFDPPYPFYEEWLRKTIHLKKFFAPYIKNIISGN